VNLMALSRENVDPQGDRLSISLKTLYNRPSLLDVGYLVCSHWIEALVPKTVFSGLVRPVLPSTRVTQE